MTVETPAAPTSPGYRMFSAGPEPLVCEDTYYRLLNELEALTSPDFAERVADAVCGLVSEPRDDMACRFEGALADLRDRIARGSLATYERGSSVGRGVSA